MTKEEILAAAGYPNTPEGIAAFYEEYDSPDAFFAKHGGSLSGAPHNGQPTADQFFKFGEPTAGNMNIPMGNPRFLADGGVYYGGPTYPMAYGGGLPIAQVGYNLTPEEAEYLKNNPLSEDQIYNVSDDTHDLRFTIGPNNTITSLQKRNPNWKVEKTAQYADIPLEGENYDFAKKYLENDIKNIYQESLVDKLNRDVTSYTPSDDFKQYINILKERKKKGENLDGYDNIYHYLIDNTQGKPLAQHMIENYKGYNPSALANYLTDEYFNKRYGGNIAKFCWGGLPGGPNEKPKMLKGGFNSPMNYGSFPAIEEGGAFDASNADDYPMLEEGGLKKILRAAANNMKKQYAKGGKTSLEGGAQNNIPQQRSQNFKDFIKSNVYNNMVDEEMGTLQQATDEAMTMQYGGMNPGMYANMFTGANMYQGAGSYPGMINYRQPTAIDPKTKMFQTALQDRMSAFEEQKQEDNMNMFNAANKFVMQSPKWFGQTGGTQPWFRSLSEMYGRKAAPKKGASLLSQMFPNPRRYEFSNEDYSKLQELGPNFRLEGLSITPEYGAVARSLGKFGRRVFGPKSVTYDISGDLGDTGPRLIRKLGKPPLVDPNVINLGKRKDGGLAKFQSNIYSGEVTPLTINTPAPNWQSQIPMPDPAEELRNQAMQAAGMSKPIEMKGVQAPTSLGKDPYSASVKLERNYKGLGKALGQAAIPTFNWLASKGEEKQYAKFQQDLENSQVADRTFIANRGNRGNYDPNTGMFRPDQMVPVQFPGGIYNQVGMGMGMYGEYGGSFANGGIPMALSGLEVKMRPGLYGTNGNRQFSLPTQVDSQKFAQQPIDVRDTLRPVPREEANLEAEKDETVLMNVGGIPAHFKIGGKRHFEGGTPLNLPENSFIYSDTSKMKIKDPTILAQFGMAPKKSGYTPAEIAKKYDINSYRKILSDPTSDDLQRKTAERMIANNNLMLSKLSLIQESKKGFPQGIPVVGMPYIMSQGIEADELLPEVDNAEAQPDADMGVARYGGNMIHQFLTKRNGGDLPIAQKGKITHESLDAEERRLLGLIEEYRSENEEVPKKILDEYVKMRNQRKALGPRPQEPRTQMTYDENATWYDPSSKKYFDAQGRPIKDDESSYFGLTALKDFFGDIADYWSGDRTDFAAPTKEMYDYYSKPNAKSKTFEVNTPRTVAARESMKKLYPGNVPWNQGMGAIDYFGNVLTLPLNITNAAYLTGNYGSTGSLYGDILADPSTYFGSQMIKAPFQASKYVGTKIAKLGPEVVEFVKKYGPEVAAFIEKYGKKGWEVIKDLGEGAVEAVKKYGPKLLQNEFFGNVVTSAASKGISGYTMEKERMKKTQKIKEENAALKQLNEQLQEELKTKQDQTTPKQPVKVQKVVEEPVVPEEEMEATSDVLQNIGARKKPTFAEFQKGLQYPKIQAKPKEEQKVKDVEVKKKSTSSKPKEKRSSKSSTITIGGETFDIE